MALIRFEYCRDCETETNHTDNVCNVCREKLRRQAMAAWKAQTVEEKLIDIHKRLLKLEAGKPTY